MKKVLIIFTLFGGAILAACNEKKDSDNSVNQNTTIVKNVRKIIVDVRTREEWNEDGHAACSVNFPLDELHLHTDTLKQFDQIEVVCKSGGRAASAQEMLESMGFNKVDNLGSWENIQCPR